MKTKHMIKKSSARNSTIAEQVSKCHDIVCDDIERQMTKLKAWSNLKNTQYESRWKAGTCKICGEHMEYCITHYHAQLHGYKRAEDLIKADMIKFD